MNKIIVEKINEISKASYKVLTLLTLFNKAQFSKMFWNNYYVWILPSIQNCADLQVRKQDTLFTR